MKLSSAVASREPEPTLYTIYINTTHCSRAAGSPVRLKGSVWLKDDDSFCFCYHLYASWRNTKADAQQNVQAALIVYGHTARVLHNHTGESVEWRSGVLVNYTVIISLQSHMIDLYTMLSFIMNVCICVSTSIPPWQEQLWHTDKLMKSVDTGFGNGNAVISYSPSFPNPFIFRSSSDLSLHWGCFHSKLPHSSCQEYKRIHHQEVLNPLCRRISPEQYKLNKEIQPQWPIAPPLHR